MESILQTNKPLYHMAKYLKAQGMSGVLLYRALVVYMLALKGV